MLHGDIDNQLRRRMEKTSSVPQMNQYRGKYSPREMSPRTPATSPREISPRPVPERASSLITIPKYGKKVETPKKSDKKKNKKKSKNKPVSRDRIKKETKGFVLVKHSDMKNLNIATIVKYISKQKPHILREAIIKQNMRTKEKFWMYYGAGKPWRLNYNSIKFMWKKEDIEGTNAEHIADIADFLIHHPQLGPSFVEFLKNRARERRSST